MMAELKEVFERHQEMATCASNTIPACTSGTEYGWSAGLACQKSSSESG